MTTLAIFSALIGLVVGIWFRFLVLVPVLFIGSVSLVVISMAQGQTLLRTISAAVVFATLLQVGYVGTALFRSIARAPRATRAVLMPPGLSLPGSPDLR
jgi:hypothetical protein